MEDPIAVEKQAWDEYKELCMLVKNDIQSVLRKGELLKNLRDTDRYKKLGDGGYDTFNSFLNDPALKISRSYAFQHIQMFDFYIIDLKLTIDEVADIASIKLMRDCMTYITNHNLDNIAALEIIDKAKALSYGDFFKEITGEDLPRLDTPVEGQVVNPDTTNGVTMSKEQEQEMSGFTKPEVKRCEYCHKTQINYFEDQICSCDGTFHLVNKTLDMGSDYQHETPSLNTQEGSDE